MTEREENPGGRRVLWMCLCGLGIVMVMGMIAGYVGERGAAAGTPFDTTDIVFLSIFAALIAALGLALWYQGRKLAREGGKLLRRERLNQRVLVASGLLGGLISIALLASASASGESPSLLAATAIEPWLAILLAAIIGIGLPALSWFWHNRVIDEQEADAYRSGALIAIYFFWIVAPVWWLLWRGGMLPAPDGIALYLATNIIAAIVWIRKKYA